MGEAEDEADVDADAEVADAAGFAGWASARPNDSNGAPAITSATHPRVHHTRNETPDNTPDDASDDTRDDTRDR